MAFFVEGGSNLSEIDPFVCLHISTNKWNAPWSLLPPVPSFPLHRLFTFHSHWLLPFLAISPLRISSLAHRSLLLGHCACLNSEILIGAILGKLSYNYHRFIRINSSSSPAFLGRKVLARMASVHTIQPVEFPRCFFVSRVLWDR